jgi:pimeloyl-ACP methyl ester carboxylesterase
MKEVSIDCGFGKIKGLCWGAGNKNKILALHGWLDNAASFYHLAPMLAKKGFEVIAIDFAGHGHSDHRATGHFSHFIDYVLDIQELLDVLKWEKPILLGHSMGGAMAQMYCAAKPENVAQLIFIENLGPVPAYEKGSAAKNLRTALLQWKNHTLEHKHFYASIDQALKMRLEATPMAANILRPMVERGLKPTAKGYHWRTDKRLRLRSLFRFTEEVIQDMLAAQKTPTLLILAKPYTYALSYATVEQRIEKLNAKQVVMLDGHHHLHMDEADAVFATIINYLAKTS